MMRVATKSPAFEPPKEATFVAGRKAVAHDAGGSQQQEDVEWEVRPGGMLVQRRNPDQGAVARPPAPTVCVRVKYGAAHHEIYLSSQACFGELKKLLSVRTGLHPQDQKLLFKGKERESSAFLDISGVKDRSKVVLLEDAAAQARRFLEMRKTAKMDKAARSISQISLEVDKLANKVSQLESIVSKGSKVAEPDVVSLMEQLMNQLLKLDAVMADGNVKTQRRVQVRRIQEYVETLDVIKIKNSMARSDTQMMQLREQQQQEQQQYGRPRQQVLQTVHQPVVVTKNWETFDLLSGPQPIPIASAAAAVAPTTTTAVAPIQRFEWELF